MWGPNHFWELSFVRFSLPMELAEYYPTVRRPEKIAKDKDVVTVNQNVTRCDADEKL